MYIKGEFFYGKHGVDSWSYMLWDFSHFMGVSVTSLLHFSFEQISKQINRHIETLVILG